MNYLADGFTLLLLAIIIIQDLRSRAISWILIPLLFFSVLGCAMLSGASTIGRFFIFNAGFIIIQLLLIIIYFSIRSGKIINVIDRQIGLGDILLLPVLALAFSPFNFMAFYVTVLLLSLFGITIWKYLFKRNTITVPLAGTLSMGLSLVICLKLFFGINQYDDTLLIAFIGVTL